MAYYRNNEDGLVHKSKNCCIRNPKSECTTVTTRGNHKCMICNK